MDGDDFHIRSDEDELDSSQTHGEPAEKTEAARSEPVLPPSGSSGAELDQLMSKLAFEEMGKENADWLRHTYKMGTIKFGNVNSAKQKIFIKGNTGLIYRGNKCMRTAPFVIKTDLESKHSWAEFEQHAFYGKSPPPAWMFWERAKIKLILIGLNKNSNYCDNLNGEGYLAKFDENAIAQLPMYARYEKSQLDELMEDGRHNSQVHILWRKISTLDKDKSNWMFIGIILVIVIVIAAVAGFMLLFPNAFSGIASSVSHALGGLLPPGTPTHTAVSSPAP